MGLHAHAQEFEPSERRTSIRSRVSCPVQVQLPSGQRIGCMIDLSEQGARVQMDNPPRAGSSVVLEWLCYDGICKVIWATEDMCGLQFERAIPSTRVLEVMQYREEFSGPIAEVGNIPLGQKRSRLGSGG
jgi:hypothetical protein